MSSVAEADSEALAFDSTPESTPSAPAPSSPPPAERSTPAASAPASDAVERPSEGPKSLSEPPQRLRDASGKFTTESSEPTQPEAGGLEPAAALNIPGIDHDLAMTALSYGYTPEQLQLYSENPNLLRNVLQQQNARVLGLSNPPPPQFMQQPPYQPAPGPQYPPQGMQQPMPYLGPQQVLPPGAMPPPNVGQSNYFPGQQQGFQPTWGQTKEEVEAWDARLIQNFQGLQQHLEQQVGALQNQLMQMQQMGFEQQRQAQEQARQAQLVADVTAYDAHLAQLGPAFEAIFGKGSWDKVLPDTPQGQARVKVFQAYDQLQGYYRQRGQNPDPKSLLRSAAQSVLGEQWTYIEQQAARRGGAQAGISRPQSRSARKPQGEQAASQFANQFYRDRGIEPIPRDDDEIESML